MKKFWIIAVNGVAHVFGERFVTYEDALLEAERRAKESPKNTFLILGLRAFSICENNEVETVDYGGEGGGTSDYNELSNLPQINSITLAGNLTLEDLNIVSLTDFNVVTETIAALQLQLSRLTARVEALENNDPYEVSYNETTGLLTVGNNSVLSDDNGDIVLSNSKPFVGE